MKKIMPRGAGSAFGGKKIIGIDVGATKITGIVFNGKKIQKELTIATPKTFFEFKRGLFKLVDFLSAENKISGVGIGLPGRADPESGEVKLSRNFKFQNEENSLKINFIRLFKSRYRFSVKIDNDANCFTRAEMVIGQGRNFRHFLGIIFGTGMGGGIVINKKLYRGVKNRGGEIGSMVLDKGFVEKKYFHPARNKNDYKALGAVCGRTFASLINIFAPQALILGGGVSLNASKKFLPGAKKEMQKFLLKPGVNTQILVSKLKNAGALGAALLFK